MCVHDLSVLVVPVKQSEFESARVWVRVLRDCVRANVIYALMLSMRCLVIAAEIMFVCVFVCLPRT